MLFSLIFSHVLTGQRIYVLDFKNRLGWISPVSDTCEFHSLCHLVAPTGVLLTDISFHPNGKFYVLGSLGELFETDTATCQMLPIGNFPVFNGTQYTSLTADKNGNLFAAGDRLATFNPKTGKFEDRGKLPNFGIAAGDLTFRDGQLFLVTIENAMLQVDIDDPQKSTLLFRPPSFIGASIYGIVSSADGCLSQKTWATVSNSTQNEHFLYEIDFEMQSAALACSLPEGILGAATREEFHLSDCDSTTVNPPGAPGFSIFIPNIFSPNDDGKNDFFTIQADPTHLPTIRFLKIYDRWGGLVFEKTDFPANDPPLGWDGRWANSGKKVGNGVYVFQALVEFENGSFSVENGSVTVAR